MYKHTHTVPTFIRSREMNFHDLLLIFFLLNCNFNVNTRQRNKKKINIMFSIRMIYVIRFLQQIFVVHMTRKKSLEASEIVCYPGNHPMLFNVKSNKKTFHVLDVHMEFFFNNNFFFHEMRRHM